MKPEPGWLIADRKTKRDIHLLKPNEALSMPMRCEAAAEYEAWCIKLAKQLPERLTREAIASHKLYVTEQYLARRRTLPAPHQNYTGDEHRCLFHVFVAAWEELQTLELALLPKPIVDKPVKQQVAVQFPGLLIGSASENPIDSEATTG